VTVTITGNARDIVRYAKLRGLLCVASTAPPEVAFGATLEISGPLALFHRTRVYGNALASLVPRVSWCDRFELSAECLLTGETRALRVSTHGNARSRRQESMRSQRFRAFGLDNGIGALGGYCGIYWLRCCPERPSASKALTGQAPPSVAGCREAVARWNGFDWRLPKASSP
jgi:hypothetical protein